MADSQRQLIVNAIEDRLKSIVAGTTVTLRDGSSHTYRRTLTDHVHVWRSESLRPDESLAIIVRDLQAPVVEGARGASFGEQIRELSVEVELLVVEQFPAEEARYILHDLIAAVGVDPTFGALARWSDLRSDALTVRDDVVGGLAGARLEYAITYRTKLWSL